MDNIFSAYLPQDRYRALLRGEPIPEIAHGTALFADISGFTSLTEKLTQRLGARRGIEEFTKKINAVYQPLILEIERFGGSAIGFAGDSITCWFNESEGQAAARAVTCAQAMQQVMQSFENLTLKIAITSGTARRLVVGNPEIQLMDTLAGAVVVRLSTGEHLAKQGEVLLDENSFTTLGRAIKVGEWRVAETGERFAVLKELILPQAPHIIEMPSRQLDHEALRAWVPPMVYEREQRGLGSFLTELRPAVALFLRFSGIDYDTDEQAGVKLDAFICKAQEILDRFDGNLLQLTIGDKGSYLYASFGIPITHEDDALRAVQAAWELSQIPQELRSIATVQIGISKGTMRAGAYGGQTRRTYGALGDDTNLAARLMTTAAPGEILVSGRVHKLIVDDFSCEPRPPLLMKGKAEPLPVFAVTGLRRRRAVRLEEPIYTLPMVGRKTEMDIIHEKLTLVLQGHGQVIGIRAEAGMGKSRLTAEVIRLALNTGFTGYGGACEASGMNTAYLVWKPIWQAFFNIDLASSPRRQLRTLEAEVEDRVPARKQAIPVLSTLLNIDNEENEFTRTLVPKDRHNILTVLLEDCLKNAASEEPLLLILEDVHWIDPLSHDLLESLARVCMNLSVCILLTYRPPGAVRLQKERVEALSNYTRLELSSLNTVEIDLLIRAKLAQLYPEQTASLPKELVAKLTDRAEGNPFYIEELLNYLHDRGLNPYNIDDRGFYDLPSSLHALILSRIDQLTEAQKITLKVASIIGRLFQVSWMQGYYPSLGQEAQLKSNLAELAQTDLTVLDTPEPELAYFFKHILTRDIIYESLSYDTRLLLHEQLAQFIETLGEDRSLDLIAYHYGLSQNTNKQMEYFQKAGDAAKALYANEAALEYYQRLEPLLAEPDLRINLHINRGKIFMLLGRLPEAEAEYRSALELSQQTGARKSAIRCQRLLGTVFLYKGDFPNALEWAGLAQTGAQQIGDWEVQAQALITIGYVNHQIENRSAAQEAYRAVLKLAQENQNLKLEAIALYLLSYISMLNGNYIAAQKDAEDGLRLLNTIGDKEEIANVLNRLGLIAWRQGDKTTARDYYEKSLSISREIGDKIGVSVVLANLALIASNDTDAKTLNDEALNLARESGFKEGIISSLNNLGSWAARQADYPSAQAYFKEGLALAREVGDKRDYAGGLLNLGYLACEQGDFTQAQPLIQESLELYQEFDSKWGIIYSLVAMSAIAASQNVFQFAVKLASAAEVIRNSIDLDLEPDGSRLYERALSTTRAAMNSSDFEAAWEIGRQLTVEEAIALALFPTPKIAPD